MLWNRKKEVGKSIDEEFHLQLKKFQLKNRVRLACTDTTDYDLMLRDFCTRNKNNALLLTRVAGYRTYLIGNGCTNQQAAKLTLEEYRH